MSQISGSCSHQEKLNFSVMPVTVLSNLAKTRGKKPKPLKITTTTTVTMQDSN